MLARVKIEPFPVGDGRGGLCQTRVGDIVEVPDIDDADDEDFTLSMIRLGVIEPVTPQPVISAINRLAERIGQLLAAAGPAGLSRTALRNQLQRHPSAARVRMALTLLAKRGMAYGELVPTAGRSREVWRPRLPDGGESS